MTAKKATKKPAAGAGRVSNSEPRSQVFTKFAGCNFQLSPRDELFNQEYNWHKQDDQTDLQQNYMVIQHDAQVDPNGSIEVVQPWRMIGRTEYTSYRHDKASICINSYLYVAAYDNSPGGGKTTWCIRVYKVKTSGTSEDPLNPVSVLYPRLPSELEYGTGDGIFLNTSESRYLGNYYMDGITDFEYVNDKLVVKTGTGHCFCGNVPEVGPVTNIYQAYFLSSPVAQIRTTQMVAHGITFTTTQDATHTNRLSFCLCFNTEWGTTAANNPCTIYTSKPWALWNESEYIEIVEDTARWLPAGQSEQWITSVDLYFLVDDAREFSWAARYEFPARTPVPGSPSLYPYIGGAFTIPFKGVMKDASDWTSVPLRPSNKNTSRGPQCQYVTVIDNRLWFWGGYWNGSSMRMQERIYIGGNPGNYLSYNEYTGGGWVDCEPGHGNRVEYICKYKTQSGNDIVTALVSNPNTHMDYRYNMVETNVSLSSEQTLRVWQAEQVAGAIGVRGRYGAQVCQDGLYSVTTYGLALTTLTMEYNSQIVTNYVSDAIKPAFTDFESGYSRDADLVFIDGILYLWLNDTEMLFAYDISLKAWWTISLPYNVSAGSVQGICLVDYENEREGLGMITDNCIYVMGTNMEFDQRDLLLYRHVRIESGELGTKQPLTQWHHVTQFEFNFQYFMGECYIDVIGIDRFGRKVVTTKHVHTRTPDWSLEHPLYYCEYNHTVFMRIDQTLESYKIRIRSYSEVAGAGNNIVRTFTPINFRLTHFAAKVYPKSGKIGIMYGFDDRQSFTWNNGMPTKGDIHPTFKSYEDIRKAVIP